MTRIILGRGKILAMTSGIALAAEHDAAGRYDHAIDALAAAAQQGDVEATTALALRLLIGDRAPYLPKEAAQFLLEAMQRGSAEAAVRLATLAALGAHVRQSWSDALGLLVIAAERGSDSARGQLCALAAEPAPQAAPSSDYWRRLAQGVNSHDWTVAPSGVTLSPKPLVRSFPHLVSAPVCDWLIAQSRGRLERALVFDPATGRDIADHTRTNSAASFHLGSADVVQVALQCRMAAACGLPLHNFEGPAVLHYAVGEEIENHFDFVDPATPNYASVIEKQGERIVTFLVYLNDDYDGGETDFPQLGVRHRGSRGEGLMFVNALPAGGPDLRMVHAGLPPVRGEKWIVSQFVRNRPSLNARSAVY
ncbi:MAG TPA: 2OG-Fe(II) oxygenase [Gammaproteobacteria bacterium]|nr:2OG-Fe(II) oxygenase [Gammaproteobacteria bacterium]